MALLFEPSISPLTPSEQKRRSKAVMDTFKWLIRAGLAAVAWAWLGIGGAAQAETIPPTDPGTLKLVASPTVTLSLYQLDSTLPSTITSSSPSRCTTRGLGT